MGASPEEEYIMYSVKKAKESDYLAARAWTLTGSTLYPNNFNMQFEAYRDEKAANNFEKAAKSFSCIILGFDNQPAELWDEIGELSAALRAESETMAHQEFYVRMFQLVSEDVQRKILLATVNNSENNLENCKLLLLLLKRFPHTIFTHSARLLEIIMEGFLSARCKYQEMLVQEVLPLLHKTPNISSNLVHDIFNISFEYYVQKIFEPGANSTTTDTWKQMFHILSLCAETLNWLPFLPYNKNWGNDLCCQKLLQTVATNPSTLSDKSALYYATTLFMFALQEYMSTIKIKIADSEVRFCLVVGFLEGKTVNATTPQLSTSGISVIPPCSSKASTAFLTAANCWQLLNSKELKPDFTQLLRNLPVAGVIHHFLFDLAVYSGRHGEAKSLLQEMEVSGLEKTIRQLILNLMLGPITSQNFDSILNVLKDIPTISGNRVNELSAVYSQQHLIMPLTRNAVLQYCTKAIIHSLKQKVCDNCSDIILGDILVLLQLDFKREKVLAEEIFTIIKSKRQFSYILFSRYLILIDILEEFMNILYNGDFNLEFNTSHSITITRRIGTRSADKEVREDCKQIMQQQVTKSSDDLFTLVLAFITEEYAHIRNIL